MSCAPAVGLPLLGCCDATVRAVAGVEAYRWFTGWRGLYFGPRGTQFPTPYPVPPAFPHYPIYRRLRTYEVRGALTRRRTLSFAQDSFGLNPTVVVEDIALVPVPPGPYPALTGTTLLACSAAFHAELDEPTTFDSDFNILTSTINSMPYPEPVVTGFPPVVNYRTTKRRVSFDGLSLGEALVTPSVPPWIECPFAIADEGASFVPVSSPYQFYTLPNSEICACAASYRYIGLGKSRVESAPGVSYCVGRRPPVFDFVFGSGGGRVSWGPTPGFPTDPTLVPESCASSFSSGPFFEIVAASAVEAAAVPTHTDISGSAGIARLAWPLGSRPPTWASCCNFAP